jgi:ABC-2 type transport system ATP-binding protein
LALMHRGKVIALGAPAELRHQASAHSLLRLDSSQPLETMRALEDVAGVVDAAVFGGGLHVTVDDPESTAERIRVKLASVGIEVRRLEKILPSLEDVFVSMIEGDERRAA